MKPTDRGGHWGLFEWAPGQWAPGVYVLYSAERRDKGRALGFVYQDRDSSRWAAHDAELLYRIGLYPTQEAASRALETHLNLLAKVDG